MMYRSQVRDIVEECIGSVIGIIIGQECLVFSGMKMEIGQ